MRDDAHEGEALGFTFNYSPAERVNQQKEA